MKIDFRNFDDSYYDQVCDFLIELSKDDRTHINWNWARWEWMFFHPDFNHDLMDKIGLWYCNDELVGLATFDHYFGEAFFAAKPGYEELQNDILEYTTANFSNEHGLGIAVNDKDTHMLDLLHSKKYAANDMTENILELTLSSVSLDYTIPEDITVKNMDIENDLYKLHHMLWKAFDNEGSVPVDDATMSKQKTMMSARNMNPFLHIVAENEEGEYVAYCGLWYSPKTDYVYVEPVCTLPEYRKKGLGKAVILEALKRGRSLGAEKAYVISDSPFYKSLGFQQHSHYTFYWHKD
ncbi:GNAT family N-acetyltransferase [Paenibacillus sp. PCH8]|uniref:GNAT family N-acetyltransferase n=1 Tax=Paenibacillus sp. PCH8 TaxID=2066524 RepID=UPI000CF88FC8|nr:GNAT family N-acetyltransferase [Paenibacillus sp. PCH8]PQP81745.1 GNAT family N-acetyltransferase [Paenibacillus sp. PCH8]